MKVVCINNGEMVGAVETSVNLTIGKVYDAIGDLSDSVYYIINDIGDKCYYHNGRFESLEEHRNKKLNKILDK